MKKLNETTTKALYQYDITDTLMSVDAMTGELRITTVCSTLDKADDYDVMLSPVMDDIYIRLIDRLDELDGDTLTPDQAIGRDALKTVLASINASIIDRVSLKVYNDVNGNPFAFISHSRVSITILARDEERGDVSSLDVVLTLSDRIDKSTRKEYFSSLESAILAAELSAIADDDVKTAKLFKSCKNWMSTIISSFKPLNDDGSPMTVVANTNDVKVFSTTLTRYSRNNDGFRSISAKQAAVILEKIVYDKIHNNPYFIAVTSKILTEKRIVETNATASLVDEYADAISD